MKNSFSSLASSMWKGHPDSSGQGEGTEGRDLAHAALLVAIVPLLAVLVLAFLFAHFAAMIALGWRKKTQNACNCTISLTDLMPQNGQCGNSLRLKARILDEVLPGCLLGCLPGRWLGCLLGCSIENSFNM